MSDYREAHVRCPRCAIELVRGGAGRGCGTCGGVWIEEGTLDEMVREMHDGLGALRLTERTADRQVGCPACAATLEAVVLEGVPVERCAAGHGVWFDADELEAALRAVAAAPPAEAIADGAPDVRIGFWRGLFGAIGGLLGIVGYGVVGAAGVAAAGVVVGTATDDQRRQWRRDLDRDD